MEACIDSPRTNIVYHIGTPQIILVSGWVFFDNEPAEYIKITLDREIILIERLNNQRSDLISVYPFTGHFNSPLGFRYELTLPDGIKPGVYKLSFYALNSEGNESHFGTVEMEAALPQQPAVFSQRFKIIPGDLMLQVNGSLSEEDFLRIGSEAADIIQKNISGIERFDKILDFGCGLGRILMPMISRLQKAKFIGFDIDPMMLKWASYLYGDTICDLVPTTLELPDNEFDLIYAVSVFSHIDRTRDYWFMEIHRLLKPDGRAFITYQDEVLFNKAAEDTSIPDIQEGYKLDDYFVSGKDSREGGSLKGTFYTTEHWNRTISKYFNIESTVQGGILGQSFSVVTKKYFS